MAAVGEKNMNKFKFGDRVKHERLGECVVINSSELFCYVMNEKGNYSTMANHESLKPIPHPDTVRLNFIQEMNMRVSPCVVQIKSTYDPDYYHDKNTIGMWEWKMEIVQPDGKKALSPSGGLYSSTLRDCIDYVMKLEQAND